MPAQSNAVKRQSSAIRVNFLVLTSANGLNPQVTINVSPIASLRYSDSLIFSHFATFTEPYEALLQRNNAVDLDDLIAQSAALLSNFPALLDQTREHCRHLMVDEFQDTNTAQYRLAKLLAAPERSLCAVGDPDQSIYSWRHANSENIHHFRRDFPEAHAVNLELNYRSPAIILQAAKTLINHNPDPRNPNLAAGREAGIPISRRRYRDPQEEAEAIALETLRLARETGINPSQCAVLYRVNHQAQPIIKAGLKLGLPCRTPETDRSAHRRTLEDLVPCPRAAANPRDSISLEQIINTPCRGISPRTLHRLKERARNADATLLEALRATAAARENGGPDPAGLHPQCAAAAAHFHRRLVLFSLLGSLF